MAPVTILLVPHCWTGAVAPEAAAVVSVTISAAVGAEVRGVVPAVRALILVGSVKRGCTRDYFQDATLPNLLAVTVTVREVV